MQKKLIAFVVFVFTSTALLAQVSPPPGSGNAPIDGGLALLLAAGIGYGVYKKKVKTD